MIPVLNVTDDITHCGHIGHIVHDFRVMCRLAKQFDFKGVNVDLRNMHETNISEKKALLQDHDLHAIACGFTPDIFNLDKDAYHHSVECFRREIDDAAALGCQLSLCYIPPFSNDSFDITFTRACERLSEIKPLLIDYQMKIGFEFIGPQETRLNTPYDFIHTIDGTRALICAAGLYGIGGYKLDIHHWQYSGATLLDLHHMDLAYILYVEVNDSLPGYTLETVPEFERELPLTTGGTHIKDFMCALAKKNYTGPIAVEPWSKALSQLPIEEAIKQVRQSLTIIHQYCSSIGD